MLSRPRWRRRTFLVNRKLQLRFMALLLLQMGIILGALGVLVRSHLTRAVEIASNLPLAAAGEHYALTQEMTEHIQGFYTRSLVLAGCTITLLLCFGLLASHKLAGPLVKLERYLHAVADGDHTQRIAFRRNDHLDGFAASVNRMTDSLERRSEHARELALELARRAQSGLDESDPRTTLTEMRRLVIGLKEAV